MIPIPSAPGPAIKDARPKGQQKAGGGYRGHAQGECGRVEKHAGFRSRLSQPIAAQLVGLAPVGGHQLPDAAKSSEWIDPHRRPKQEDGDGCGYACPQQILAGAAQPGPSRPVLPHTRQDDRGEHQRAHQQSRGLGQQCRSNAQPAEEIETALPGAERYY